MKAISLAESNDINGVLAVSKPSGPSEFYPRVTLRETNGLKLPDEGEITLKFRKVRSEEEVVNGKKRYCCTLELEAILDVEDTGVEEPASNKNKDAGEALDALRKEKMDESDEGEEY